MHKPTKTIVEIAGYSVRHQVWPNGREVWRVSPSLPVLREEVLQLRGALAVWTFRSKAEKDAAIYLFERLQKIPQTKRTKSQPDNSVEPLMRRIEAREYERKLREELAPNVFSAARAGKPKANSHPYWNNGAG